MERVPFALPSLFVLLAGCGGSGLSTPSGDTASTLGSTCSFQGPIPKAPAPTYYSSSAHETGEAFLHAFVAPYLSGETTVYHGTFSATDNAAKVLGGASAHSVSTSTAIAALTVANGVATLTIHDPATHLYVELDQGKKDPSATRVGIILSDTASGGNGGSCQTCAPDLFGRPDTIDIQNASASTLVGTGAPKGFTLDTQASATLTRVDPCDLSFDDLAELNRATKAGFAQIGDAWAWDVKGSEYDPSCKPYEQANYQVQLFIQANDFASYGVKILSRTCVTN